MNYAGSFFKVKFLVYILKSKYVKIKCIKDNDNFVINAKNV